MESDRPVGLTKDAGWQIGATRTFPAEIETAWDFLLSEEGLEIWLGAGVTSLQQGESYAAADGTSGEVRSLRSGDRVRLTWQPEGRGEDATVQMALRPASSGCAVRFHTERLSSADEREEMRRHWHSVLDRIGEMLPA